MKEQICNCSGVPSNNANSVILQTRKYVREIRTGADLQIFLEKRMTPLFRRLEKNLCLNQFPSRKKYAILK